MHRYDNNERRGSQSIDQRGRDGLSSPCARMFVFQIRTANARTVLVLFSERGRKITNSKEEVTRARAKERTGLAKGDEAGMENGSRTAHTWRPKTGAHTMTRATTVVVF